MLRKFFCIALIALGAGLDGYFYIFRFRADGVILPVAIAAALALELLLAFAVWNAQNNKLFTIMAITITLYAVIQTSAGQTFSLLSHSANAGNTESTNVTLIEEEKKNLIRIDDEYKIITRQLASIKTVEAQADYSGTIKRMTGRLAELTKVRVQSVEKISALSSQNSTDEKDRIKNMSVYDFYASIPAWRGMDWLKFIFHTVLSILIAIMTPVGILTWNVRTASRILKKSSLTDKEISVWVSRCWKKIALGTNEKILSERAFTDWCEHDGVVISPGVYLDCARRAVALGIITRDGMALVKDEQLIKEKLIKGR